MANNQKLDQREGDAWKETANRMKSMSGKAGPAVRKMISCMDQIWPFSNSAGILDNGCGTGSIISYVLDEYGAQIPPSATILAGDFSDAMLDVLRTRRQTLVNTDDSVWERLQIRKVDAHQLEDIGASSLSHVTGGHVYFLLDDPRKALKATHHVLCPGGVIGMSSGKSSQHVDALCDAVEAVKQGTNLRLLKEPWNSEDGVHGELEACGFEDIQIFLVESLMNYNNAGDFAAGLLTMPVMKDVMVRFSDDEKVQVRAALIDNLKAADVGHTGTLSGVNIVAVGRKPRTES